MAVQITTRAIEKIVRGFSCHRRVQILDVLDGAISPMSLSQITKFCRADFRTIGQHMLRLCSSGLVRKHNQGRLVMHEITPLGRRVMTFLRSLDGNA